MNPAREGARFAWPLFYTMIELKNVKILGKFGINGMVIYPFILYSKKDPALSVRNHERIHAEQIKNVGVVRFYARYLREYFFHRWQGNNHHEAYLLISFEQEAYLHQHDLAYHPSGDKKETLG